jgi:hypothetical protein
VAVLPFRFVVLLVKTVELRYVANLPQTCKQDGLITVRMDDERQIGVKSDGCILLVNLQSFLP